MMASRVGQQLGNYRLRRLLGEGGFAEVYLGEHIHLRTQAAIKVLATRLEREELEHFTEEARTIAQLRHRHIVRVLEFGVEGSVPYLVMEYAPNGTLRQQHARGTRLAPAGILPSVRQVAGALQYAHDRRLIHRDVKPENMLLGESGEVLLSDFGIAIVAQSSRYQNTQDVVGTIAYMAPEQIQAHPRPASDQYSLGVVVYEWLAGERPFTGSMQEVLAKQITVPPPPLRIRVPGISPALEQVVLTALEKDPKARFASIQAFADAFEQACQAAGMFFASTRVLSPPPRQSPPPAPPLTRTLPTPPSTTAPLPRTGRPSGMAGSLGAGASTPSGAFRTGELPARSGPRQTGQQPAPSGPRRTGALPGASGALREPVPAPAFNPPGKQHFSRRTVLALAGSLAGLALAGGGVLLVHSLTQPAQTAATLGTTLLIYHGHSKSVNAVAWSSDSTRLASGGDDGQAEAWDARSGNAVVRSALRVSRVNAVAWSPGGAHIASGGVPDPVEVWDAATGEKLLTYSGLPTGADGGTIVGALAWSDDGKYLSAAGGTGQTLMVVWDASSQQTLLTIPGATAALAWSPDGRHLACATGATVQVWDVVARKLLFTYTGHSAIVNAVAWSPDGRRVASASNDRTVQVWDGGSALGGHAASASAALNAGSSRFGIPPTNTPTPSPTPFYPTGTPTNTATPTDTPTATPTVTFPPTNTVNPGPSPTSPPATSTATPSPTATAGTGPATPGTLFLTYRGHTGAVLAVAWSPDGASLVSAGEDKTAQLWSAASGSRFFTYRGHTDVVRAVAWSPDGKRVASGSADTTVQVWQASG